MKRFQDESGWLRVSVCFTILAIQYGIRDTMLTALPTIARATNSSSSDTATLDITEDNYGYVYGNVYLAEVDNGSTMNLDKEEHNIFNHSLLPSESTVAVIPNGVEGKGITEEELRSNVSFGSRSVKSEKNTETSRYFAPLSSLFRAKVGGRDMQLGSKKTRQKHVRSFTDSEADGGKYRLLSKKSDGREDMPSLFQKLVAYVRGRNAWMRDDGREFITADDSYISLGSRGENASPSFQDGWTLMREGIVLSSLYWGWLVAALLSDLIISKLRANLVLALTTGAGGLLGILTHAMSLGGPWVLLPFRILLGASQGLCYSAVTLTLKGVPDKNRMLAALVVLMGPPLGSSIGVILGNLEKWYISTYVLGSLAVPLTPMSLMLPKDNERKSKKIPVKSVMKSGGALACIFVYSANIFTLHTVMVGLPFCLAYTDLDDQPISGVSLLSVVLAVSVTARMGSAISISRKGKGPLTVLNKRRLPVVLGSLLILSALIVMATAGLNDHKALVSLSVCGVGLGTGLTRFACRLNFEDLSPWMLPSLLSIVDTAGIFMAIWPPLLVSGLAQNGDGLWMAIWLIPLALVVPSAVAYVFLLTANPQSWDERPVDPKATGMSNGSGPPKANSVARGYRLSFKSARSGLSFKSAKTSLTFKTAVSRKRTRTGSTRTADEDLSVDMRSAIDEDEPEVHSIADTVQECKSVASTDSFKSDGADMHSIELNDPPPVPVGGGGEVYDAASPDRTSAWLSYHHQVSVESAPDPSPAPTKQDIRKRNAIYDLFW